MQHRLNSACKGPATNRTTEVFYSLGENFSVSEAKVLIKVTKKPKDSDNLYRNEPQSRLSTIEIMISRYKKKFKIRKMPHTLKKESR